MVTEYEKNVLEQALDGMDSLDRMNFLLEMEKMSEKVKANTSRQFFIKRLQECFTSLALEPNKAGDLLDVIDEYVRRGKE